MKRNGADVSALIASRQREGMSPEAASREVVADGMVDILPESSFMRELHEKSPKVFGELLSKLKDFLGRLKSYLSKLGTQKNDVSHYLKTEVDGTIRNFEDVVNAFDELARSAKANRDAASVSDRASDAVFAEGRVSYMSAKEYDSEIAGIKDQIRNSQDTLNQMDVVFSGTVPASVGNKQQGTKWAVEQLHKYGYQVDRQGFGRIEFSPKEINDAMDYLDENEEKVAIVALYRVLKRGVQIGEHGDHKNRKKHTITFAAPVELNGIRGNMAVVVNVRNNKYYVHRILLPDGSAFKFEANKNADQEPQRGVPKRSLANATRSTFDNSITHPDDSVNSNTEENIQYQERSETVSDRELLANVLETGISDPAEREVLTKYKERIASLDKLEARLAEIKREIKALSFAKGKRDTARLIELRAEARSIPKVSEPTSAYLRLNIL